MIRRRRVPHWLTVLLVALSFTAVSSPSAEEFTCSSFDGSLTGEIKDKLIVDTNCLIENAKIRGNVEVLTPFTLTISDSVVKGNIECQDQESVTVQASKVSGNFTNCTVQMANETMPDGEKTIGVLYLFQKTETQGAPWPILQGGAWGIMRYSLWGEKFNFKFNGQGLTPETSYTLIYYPDPFPGEGLICLASGAANSGGKLSVNDSDFDIKTSLPADYDANYAPIAPSGAVGAKIWLVPSSDVDCVGENPEDRFMIGWNPSQYLFEYNLINFEYRTN